MEGKRGIAVNVVVEFPRAHAETRHDLPAIQRLPLAGDHAGLDEVNDRIGEHLRVNPQILLVLQELQHRLGDPADAQFQGTPVLHQRRDELADLPRHVVRLGRLELDQRRVGRDQDVQIVHTEETVAEGARHLRVDLSDDEAGVLGRALDDVYRDAQAAHPALVGRRHLDQRRIQRQFTGGEQAGNIGEKDRCIVAESFLDNPPYVFGNEETVDAETVRQVALRVRRLAECEQMHDLRVGQFMTPRHESADQFLRLRAAGADENPLTRPDARHRPRGSGDHIGVLVLPVLVPSCAFHIVHVTIRTSMRRPPRSRSPLPSAASVIRASAAMDSLPVSPTMNGLMSSSLICGKSVTS